MNQTTVRRICIVAIAAAAVALSFAFALFGCSNSSNNTPTYPGPSKFSLGPFAANQSLGRAFTTGEADVGYHCIPHQVSGMTGIVHVRSTFTGPDPTVQIGTGNALRFFPDTITVKTGGTVTWRNNSSMTIHTVTQN